MAARVPADQDVARGRRRRRRQVGARGRRRSGLGSKWVPHRHPAVRASRIGHELGVGLGDLGVGVRAGDDPAAGEQPHRRGVVGLERRRSATRFPTRRRPWRPSSRPARRSGRGPCPRARGSASSAAVGGGAAHRGRRGAATRPGSARSRRRRATPATSVARCMTLGRCSTNGDSGTLIEEQCGRRASATERTAYSCSSRSLLERASEPARARSCSSSPVRRMVPASTREVTRPFSSRTSISGVAPTRPSTAKTQVVS